MFDEDTKEKLRLEDVKKIHAEINQIINQRFQMTYIAITIFSVICGWIVTKTPSENAGSYIVTGIVFLNFVLASLYRYSCYLKSKVRVYATYLMVNDLSEWEKDWKEYRQYDYNGYSNAQANIFFTLNFIGTGGLWVINSYLSDIRPDFIPVLISLLSCAISTGYIYVVGYKKWFDTERDPMLKWNFINLKKLYPQESFNISQNDSIIKTLEKLNKRLNRTCSELSRFNNDSAILYKINELHSIVNYQVAAVKQKKEEDSNIKNLININDFEIMESFTTFLNLQGYTVKSVSDKLDIGYPEIIASKDDIEEWIWLESLHIQQFDKDTNDMKRVKKLRQWVSLVLLDILRLVSEYPMNNRKMVIALIDNGGICSEYISNLQTDLENIGISVYRLAFYDENSCLSNN